MIDKTTSGKPPRAWQRMLSGRRLDLLDPSPLDIEISDIAHGLARVARWNGQTYGDHSFSVAQHCLLVEEIIDQWHPELSAKFRLAALLHDASEYVIGDMISPFKAVIGSGYRDVEDRLQSSIHLRFGLEPELPGKLKRLIKRADVASAFFEAKTLAGFSESEAATLFSQPEGLDAGRLENFLDPWPTLDAQTRYLARFAKLDCEE